MLKPNYDAGISGEFAGAVGANIEKVYRDLDAKKSSTDRHPMHRAHRSRTLLLGLAALLTVLAFVVPLAAQSGAGGTLVFIGTYTSPASKGIYVSRLDPSTGTLVAPILAAEGRNPSFLAASADGRFLYAVSEVDAVGGKPGGAVTGYAIDKAAGTLKPLNAQSTVGGGPCHVSVAGKMVFAPTTAAAASLPIQTQDDGSLKPASTFVQHKGSSVNLDRQKGPHAHASRRSLGPFLTCRTWASIRCSSIASTRAAGTIAPATPPFATVTPAGSGPRHIALHATASTPT